MATIINLEKIKHFYINKYLITPLAKNTYLLCYNYKYNLLWFRVAKAARSTINKHLKENTPKDKHIFSSEVGYIPVTFNNFTKFAFVRNPVNRFLSAWRNKVIDQNYFHFSEKEYVQMMKLENFIAWTKEQDINNCDPHIRAQHSLIDITNLDFLGRVESFNEDFKELAKMVNMPIKEIYRKNQSQSKKIDDINPKLVDEIKSIYEMDVQIFYPHI
ncbi:MAG: sulfotransferase family 2 domain-containing protein [Vicingaceae bacterium]